jgi:hypothetical protein
LIYFGLLIQPKLASRHRIDRLSRRTSRVAEQDEHATLPEFFLVEEQPVRNLVDVMSEPNGSERSPYVHLDHHLFEVMINFDYECSGRVLVLQSRQTRSMFLQDSKQHDIEHLEDMSCVRSKCNDFHSLPGENSDHIVKRVT